MRTYFVAAEPSGDLLAREVIENMRALEPASEFAGIGGAELAEIGIQSPIDVSALSVLGLLEGLKAYGTVVRLADEAADAIIAWQPDTVVLVDSWGFTLRVAQRLRKRAPHVRLVKLVGPQVWATRPGRAKTLAATVDELICIHALETPFYDGLDIEVTVMGNPALSRTERGDAQAFRRALGLQPRDLVLLVLPGSRPGEIDAVAPVLIQAAREVKSAMPELSVVVAPAEAVRSRFMDAFPSIGEWASLLPKSVARHDAMAGATLAIACSGTVTSELAYQGTPFITGYKTGWITWAIARFFLFRKTHITLLNIAADDTEVAPEYVQTRFQAGRIADRASQLLSDENVRMRQVIAQNAALDLMGENTEPAQLIAAKAILRRPQAR